MAARNSKWSARPALFTIVDAELNFPAALGFFAVILLLPRTLPLEVALNDDGVGYYAQKATEQTESTKLLMTECQQRRGGST